MTSLEPQSLQLKQAQPSLASTSDCPILTAEVSALEALPFL